jgi:hypothetical protein
MTAVVRHVRADGLDACADRWEACRTAAPRPQMAHRLELVRGWTNGDPQAVVVEGDDGLIMGIAPLTRSQRQRSWALRLRSTRPSFVTWDLDTVEVLGEGFAAADDAITTAWLFDGVLDAAADADLVVLRTVPDGSSLAALTKRRVLKGGRWLCFDSRYPDFRHRSTLDVDVSSYLGRHLGPGSRRYLQRDVRRLERHPAGTTITCFTEPEQMGELLAHVARIEETSWHRSKRSRRLGVETTRQRLEGWAGLGLVRAYVLGIGGEPVAFALGYASDGCLTVAKMGFAEEWARRSPGKVLLWHVLDDLHRHGGFTSIDLGPGQWAFKDQFAPDGYPVRDVTLVRTRPKALVAVVPTMVWGRARAEAKRLLHDNGDPGRRVQAWVRRNLAR